MASGQNSGQNDFKIMLKVHYETVSYMNLIKMEIFFKICHRPPK